MSVVSIIAAERERYVAHFERTVSKVSSAAPESARELLISINSDTLPYPYRYFRADLISKSADGTDLVQEVWLDPPQDAEGHGFQLGPVRIELYPFTWCSTQIAFDRRVPDLSKLDALLTQWLDVSETLTSDPAGPSKAIHSATQIETNGELWFLTIDFGTAPADVLLDLIDFLANEVMADRIVITSHPPDHS